LKVKIGDKINQGDLIALAEGAAAAVAAPSPAPAAAVKPATAPAPTPAPAPVLASAPASSFTGSADLDCDLVVLGAGPGGYSAAFRAADLGLKVILVERYSTLGGVCLNVGCIPSKALLHVAAVMDEVSHFDALGISFGEAKIDLDKLRAHKSKVVSKLTGGLSAMAKMRKVTVVRGKGSLLDAQHLKVEEASGPAQELTGKSQVIRFKRAILATGSQAVRLPFLPNDPRIVDSTGALELQARPKKMLVIGGGIIGLEMGTVYSTLGAKLDVVEMLDGLMQGADRDLVKVWQKFNAHRFDKLMLKTKTVGAQATPEGIKVQFEGLDGTQSEGVYDLVLQAVGRTPNG
ncbi:MAG: dihydrolipoyl dehydrogenase family protein, partial [Inhella sp.]